MKSPSRSKTKTHKRKAAYARGRSAEWLAAAWLMLKGYRLLYWRSKTKVGEIDLIMRRRKQIIFVEVKARNTHENAAASIDALNQQRVIRAAQWFMRAHVHYAEYDFRFDAVTISCYSLPHHIPHAFSMST